jgi:hypothetical protein
VAQKPHGQRTTPVRGIEQTRADGLRRPRGTYGFTHCCCGVVVSAGVDLKAWLRATGMHRHEERSAWATWRDLSGLNRWLRLEADWLAAVTQYSTSTCSAVLRGWAWGEASPRAGVGRHARLMTSFSCVYNERGGRIRFTCPRPDRRGRSFQSRQRDHGQLLYGFFGSRGLLSKSIPELVLAKCRRAVSVLSVGIILGVRIVYGTDFFRGAGR